jgi:hypothetical protein
VASAAAAASAVGSGPRRDQREPERSDWRLLGVVSRHRDRHDAGFSFAAAPEGVERDEQNDQADE